MELIKRIKQAEAEAQEIIENAKIETTKQAQDAQDQQQQDLEEAEQQRKKAIEQAVNAAVAEAVVKTEQLNAQAEDTRQQLRRSATDKAPGAVAKVMDYLKG